MVAGSIEDLEGTVLVEASYVVPSFLMSAYVLKHVIYSALFIQPKYAKLLNTKQIREYMGEPPESNEPIVEGAVAPVPMPPDAIKDAKVTA